MGLKSTLTELKSAFSGLKSAYSAFKLALLSLADLNQLGASHSKSCLFLFIFSIFDLCHGVLEQVIWFQFTFGQRPRRGRWPMLSHREKFSPPPSSPPPPPPSPPPWLRSSNRSLKPKSQSRAWIPGSGLKFQPYGLNPSFIAHIPIFWLKSQPYDSNYSLA